MFFHPLKVGGMIDFGSINIDLLFFCVTFPGHGGGQEEDSHDSKEGVISYIIIKFYL